MTAVYDIAGELSSGFLFKSKIGEGAMGLVFLAEERRSGALVALKVMKEEWLETPEILTRFDLEAATISKIDHPNVAQIVEHGHLSDGRPWYATRYQAGRSLLAILRDNSSMRFELIIELFRQAAAGLHAAHRAGVVHRDVNLVISLCRDWMPGPHLPYKSWISALRDSIARSGQARLSDHQAVVASVHRSERQGTCARSKPWTNRQNHDSMCTDSALRYTRHSSVRFHRTGGAACGVYSRICRRRSHNRSLRLRIRCRRLGSG